MRGDSSEFSREDLHKFNFSQRLQPIERSLMELVQRNRFSWMLLIQVDLAVDLVEAHKSDISLCIGSLSDRARLLFPLVYNNGFL